MCWQFYYPGLYKVLDGCKETGRNERERERERERQTERERDRDRARDRETEGGRDREIFLVPASSDHNY